MSKSNYKWLIKPETSLLDFKIKEVSEYRDLLWLLVRRDFVSFYKQTVLGPVWFFIQPVFTVFIYTFVFGHLAGISTEGLPRPLFYLAGVVTWNYFSDCLLKTSAVFRDNAHIFGKVYFPRLIMPLSLVFSNLVRFGVQLILLLGMMLWYSFSGYQFGPNIYILLFPLLVALMAASGLGLGMIVSAMTTKYRDLAFLVQFGVPLFMYATTVVFPLSSIPQPYKWIIQLNPMTGIIETFRFGLLGQGEFTWRLLGYSLAFSIITLFLGIIIFNKVQKNFVDTV